MTPAEHQAEAGRNDARYERTHSIHIEATEARRRANRRAANGDPISAVYWNAYATEVDSWE